MIKPNKRYKVYDAKKGKTSIGNYTIVKIRDANPQKDGTFTHEYAWLFVNDDVCVYNNAEVLFTAIDGVRKKTTSYNGKYTTEVTLYITPENFKVETIGDAPADELRPLDEQDLPF